MSALIAHIISKKKKKKERVRRCKERKKDGMQWQIQIRVLNSITTKMYAKKAKQKSTKSGCREGGIMQEGRKEGKNKKLHSQVKQKYFCQTYFSLARRK